MCQSSLLSSDPLCFFLFLMAAPGTPGIDTKHKEITEFPHKKPYAV